MASGGGGNRTLQKYPEDPAKLLSSIHHQLLQLPRYDPLSWIYSSRAFLIWRRSAMRRASLALALAELMETITMLASSPMIAITTRSSIMVKSPFLILFFYKHNNNKRIQKKKPPKVFEGGG